MSEYNHKLALMGASLNTGNLGVSALAVSSITALLEKFDFDQITLLGSDVEYKKIQLPIKDKMINITILPVRLSRNIFLPTHILKYFTSYIFNRKRIQKGQDDPVYDFLQLEYAFDITGGDSFSDIYGMRRFLFNYFIKRMVMLTKKKLVMLPQTIGPFKTRRTKNMATKILRKSSMVFTRDLESSALAYEMLGSKVDQKPLVYPDVAFILPPREIEYPELNQFLENKGSLVIGLNISGLLYANGYKRDNNFGLKGNYNEMIPDLISALVETYDSKVLLIPHVIPSIDDVIENDLTAIKKIYANLSEDLQKKCFVVARSVDQSQIKSIIGKTDFFLGSRMHSCIAALSQCIPAVGLAYSKKFRGVFKMAGVEDYVVDLRSNDPSHLFSRVKELMENRENTRKKLTENVALLKNKLLEMPLDKVK